MAGVTRKEQLANGVALTPLTREEIKLAGGTIVPLTEKERFQNAAFGGKAPEGKISITANGTDIDVSAYALADVAVPASAVVSGTKSITANGTDIDVTNYAKVDVAVESGGTPEYRDVTVSNQSSQQVTVSASELGVWTSQTVAVGAAITVKAPAARQSNGKDRIRFLASVSPIITASYPSSSYPAITADGPEANHTCYVYWGMDSTASSHPQITLTDRAV